MVTLSKAQEAMQDQFEEVLAEYVRTVKLRDEMHSKYQGKAMPNDEYQKFTKARDEDEPRLRRILVAAALDIRATEADGWVLMPREMTEYEATMAVGALLDMNWTATECFAARYQDLIHYTELRRRAVLAGVLKG